MFRFKHLFLLIFSFTLAIGVISCNDENVQTEINRVFTENDFGEDETLTADPEIHLVVNFLEHPESEGHENDTGKIGNDIVPLTYSRTLEHTYCWEDENIEAKHFMTLNDVDGFEILRVEANGECITEIIEAGNYDLILHHDGKSDETFPIFLHNEDNIIASNNNGNKILDSSKKLLSNVLQNFDFIKNAHAQTVTDNITTLINTKICISCDLSGADLPFARLSDADLSNADLTGADLTGADLTGADLSEANLPFARLSDVDLSSANLSNANLTGANLTGADLSEANLPFARLSGANLFDADLGGADLSGADLSDTDLRDANLATVNLSGAVWCDGTCMCAADSTLGTCNGCEPQSSCTF